MPKTCLFAFVHLNGCNFRQAQKCASPLSNLTYIDLLLGKCGIKLTASRQQRKWKGALTRPGTGLQDIILNNFNLGVDHLTFEGVMGDFRKKYPTDRFRRKKDLARNYLAKKKFLLTEKKYISKRTVLEKKSHSTIVCQEKYFFHQSFLGKKFLPKPNHPYPYAPPPPFPLKSQMFDPAWGQTVIKRSNAYRRCLFSGDKSEAKNYQLCYALIHSITCR